MSVTDSLPSCVRPLSWMQAPALELDLPGYQVQELIGIGGMGMVYRGVQEGLGRPVAIKVLQSHHQHNVQRSRFLEEGRAVAKLLHPGIVQVFDAGEVQGQAYLVMELITGGNLEQRLKQNRLNTSDTIQLLRQLALALAHAHQHGILHRDLKPANVMLATGPEGSLAKLTDFGLARQLDNEKRLTVSGQFVGTPQYMAPEQVRGDSHITPAADIYSLGVILYECLTGQPPFEGKSELEVGWKILEHQPVPPQRLRRDIPTDLQTICLKCLAKDPAGRYRSAVALAEDLARFEQGLPVLARPLSSFQRSWLWCKRNPLVACLWCSILLVLLLGLASSSYYWWRAEQANRQLRTDFQLSHWIEMGRVHRGNRHFDQALAYFQKARNFYELELRTQKVTAPLLSGLAGCWEAEARVALQSKQPTVAREKLLIAIDIQKQAQQMIPSSNLYAMFLDQHYLLLADAHRMLGEWSEMLDAMRQRRSLRVDQPDHELFLAEECDQVLQSPALPNAYREEIIALAFSSLDAARAKGLITPAVLRESRWVALPKEHRWPRD